MNEQSKSAAAPNTPPSAPEKKPNENLGFHFSGFLKIVDPNTGEVLVHTRTE